LLTKIKNDIGKICIIYGLVASALVLLSWLAGYWLNGLLGMKFPIDSCSTLLASGFGTGLIGFFKYCADSVVNSPRGTFPNANITKGDAK